MNNIPPTETEFFDALEQLGAHCPWEEVDLWAIRSPKGHIRFTAYGEGSKGYGLDAAWGHGPTPMAALEDLKRKNPVRDPQAKAQEKIAKLRFEIAKLEAMQFEIAPYRPTPMIGQGIPVELPKELEVINIQPVPF